MGDGGGYGDPFAAGEELAQHVAYPVDTSPALRELVDRYRKSKRAQAVSFRKLIPWVKIGERATHYLHPYPAKLLPQIAHFFLAAEALAPRSATVLDPFGGTGTVALEAILSGRNAIFADVNPLARLIATAKTSVLRESDIYSATNRIRERFLRLRRGEVPDVVNIDYWYSEGAIKNLGILRRVICEFPDDDIRTFLLITFSATARKLSNADPRLSVPVRKKSGSPQKVGKKDVWKVFDSQLAANVRRMSALQLMLPPGAAAATCVGNDARRLRHNNGTSLNDGCVDLIITSPPYAGAQKYIRASSLSLGWLGLARRSDLASLERDSIGREHFRQHEIQECPVSSVSKANAVIKKVWAKNKVRALICATYLNEMEAVVSEMVRVLKPGGSLILVVGNNEVCGHVFKSSAYLQELCERAGLATQLRLVDAIKSRGLMTKRNRSASIITQEVVMLFRREITG